jgi:hypothetical protein
MPPQDINHSKGSHIITNIIYSQKPLMRWLRYLLLFTLSLGGIAYLRVYYFTLFTPLVYRKDIITEYLMAKALVAGISPYLPLPFLSNRFLGPELELALTHPSPHPPSILFLILPLTLVTYQQAAVIWFFIELCLLFFTLRLLFIEFFGETRWFPVIVGTLALIGWLPIVRDLALGQLMILIMSLTMCAWILLRRNRFLLGGFFVGLAISVKIMMWPLLIPFLVQRKYWRVLLSALCTVLFLNFFAMITIGFQTVKDYYFHIGYEVSRLYQLREGNYSLWSVGRRILGDSEPKMFSSSGIQSTFSNSSLASFISIVIVAVLILLCLLFYKRLRTIDEAFAAMTVLSILISPVSWAHYFVLTIIPFIVILLILRSTAFPWRQTTIFGIIFMLLTFPEAKINEILMLLISFIANRENIEPLVYIISRVLPFLPTVVILSLLWFIYHLCPPLVNKNGKIY